MVVAFTAPGQAADSASPIGNLWAAAFNRKAILPFVKKIIHCPGGRGSYFGIHRPNSSQLLVIPRSGNSHMGREKKK